MWSHLPLDKMTAISQTIFSDAYSWMKSFVFWFEFHWCLFLKLNCQWGNNGSGNGLVPTTSIYLNQYWPRPVYAALGGYEFKSVNFKLMSRKEILRISCKLNATIPQYHWIGAPPTSRHYLNQCWTSSMTRSPRIKFSHADFFEAWIMDYNMLRFMLKYVSS